MKNIMLLGASGSIGLQTIDVIRNYPDMFSLKAFSVGNNTSEVENLINEFNPKAVYLIDENKAKNLQAKYPNLQVFYGEDLDLIIESCKVDLLVNAVVGIAGLKPTWKAIENKIDIALANKETLVTGGDLIIEHAKKHGVKIYPIDSEHSAIWQCLIGNETKDVHGITLTASGGSFRDLSRDQLVNVSKDEALNHPNWSMGAKITIDSATMMNKGLEVIEAHYLFDVDYDNIDVILHKQSIVHSYVEFNDYSIIAQLGTADMRLPIQFALTAPNHLKLNGGSRLDLKEVSNLSFEEVSLKRYPLVKLAYDVGRLKGNKPIVMNAANEVAVNLFLNDKISFLDIETIVINTVNNYDFSEVNSIDDILRVNDTVKKYVEGNYSKILS